MIPVHVEQEFNAYDASLSGAGISSSKFKLNKLLNFIPNYRPMSVLESGCTRRKTVLSGRSVPKTEARCIALKAFLREPCKRFELGDDALRMRYSTN